MSFVIDNHADATVAVLTDGLGDGSVDLRPLVTPSGVRRPLPEMVREYIERQLLSGALHEGDQVAEYRVAKTLGISQAPVREAFRQLVADGVLVSKPHRGTYVRRVTQRDARERYSLGMELEAFAVRLAMTRLMPQHVQKLEELVEAMAVLASRDLDQADVAARSIELNVAFHRQIVEAADHRMLLQMWLSVNPRNWRFTTYTHMLMPNPVALASSHRAVLKAIMSGDQVRAAAAVRLHIWEAAESVLPTMYDDDKERTDQVM